MEMDKNYNFEMASHVKIITEKREDSIPTDEELEKIKSYYKKATKDNVAVFEMSFCNTIPDRQDDVFTDNSVDTMVRTVIGKQFINGHDTSKDSIGKIFDSYVKNVDYEGQDGKIYNNIKTGFIKVYIPKTTRHENIIEDLETGMKEYTSPGFSINKITCSICGEDYLGKKCKHLKGKEYKGKKCITILDVKECVEVSSVYLGAQYYSQIVKNFNGGEDMTLEELQVKFDTMEKDYNEYKEKYSEKSFNELIEKTNILDNFIKIFGDNVTEKDLISVKENAEIGKSAKEETIKEIKRLQGVLSEVKGISMTKTFDKFLNGADYQELKDLEKSISEAVKSIPTGKQTETSNVDVEEENNLWM